MANNLGTIITAPIRPVSDLDKFPSAYANELLGGFKIVASITERNAIPTERRTEGSLAYVIADKVTYQLQGGLADANWAEYKSATYDPFIENKGNVPSMEAGLEANRPAFGVPGRIYISFDSQRIFQDTGTEWQTVGGQDAARKTEEFIATEGQTIFTMLTGHYNINKNLVEVYVNGWKQPPSSYTEIDNTRIQMLQPLEEDDKVMVEYQEYLTSIMDIESHGEEHLSYGLDPIPEATPAHNGLLSIQDKVSIDDMVANFTKVEQSSVNGNIIINGEEKIVFTQPTYVHNQISASNIWTINHNQMRFPSVSIVDTAGDLIMADVRYVDLNTIEIRFSGQTSGKAYLN
jgi:hypothetical protein